MTYKTKSLPRREHKKIHMKRSVRILWMVFFGGVLGFTLLMVAIDRGLLGAMPSIEDLQNPSSIVASEVLADDGSSMGKFYLEDRSPVEYKAISKNVVNALISTEDLRFYDHSGIDPIALMRVARGLGTQGGGSTLTQQLALNMFGSGRASNIFSRSIQKLKEWIISVKLERNFTKDEILTYYLNTVAFSENVFGIRNAARTFFQKEPDRLSVPEAAVLVGMLNAPSKYNPRRNPKPATERRNLVLDRMASAGHLTLTQAAEMKADSIALNYKKLDQSQGVAPYFREAAVKEEVKRLLKDIKKPDGKAYDIYRDGLKIYTTINPKMQLYAEEALARTMAANQRIFNQYSFVRTGSVFEKRQKELDKFMMQSDRWKDQKNAEMSDEDNRASFSKKVSMKIFSWNAKRTKDTVMTPLDSIKYLKTHLQSGFMALEPRTGFVKAWVGGIDFKTFKIDHVNLNIKRQVGSTIKPMLYCQAIEEAGFTPETPLDNVPQNFPGFGKVPASGKGASGGSYAMAYCLAKSLNGAAAYLMKQLGPQRFLDFLVRCKLQTQLKAYPSMALGSCDISLYELMWMYTMFPGRGFNTRPQFISRIEDRNGNVLMAVGPEISEVISEVTAYTMCKMMGGAVKFGTATAMQKYGVKAEMGAKTGTTNSNTDAWFMIYTPELLCGAWVGADENWIHFPSSAAAGYGGAAALPACGSFLKSVYGDKKLGYDATAKFVKPAIEKNDIIWDYFENITGPPSPDAEGSDVGNGSADEYFGEENYVPLDTTGLNDIQGESEVIETKKPATVVKPDTSKPKTEAVPKAQMPAVPKPSTKKPEKDYR
ncbi:MAG: penicillin-binding protein [Bacteroidetes bacterium]|nr:MAG: penicillin-binding protein [Bacteroidota bacterium]